MTLYWVAYGYFAFAMFFASMSEGPRLARESGIKLFLLSLVRGALWPLIVTMNLFAKVLSW